MTKIFVYLKENKRRAFVILFVLLGLFLIFFSSFESEAQSKEGASLSEYKKQMEEELSNMCERLSGVGRCYVTLTFERGEQNTYKGSSLVETKPPKVLGVTVVCKGADSDYVKGQIVNMMSSLFDIGTNRIAVLKLN